MRTYTREQVCQLWQWKHGSQLHLVEVESEGLKFWTLYPVDGKNIDGALGVAYSDDKETGFALREKFFPPSLTLGS